MILDNNLRIPSDRTPGDPGAENVAEEIFTAPTRHRRPGAIPGGVASSRGGVERSIGGQVFVVGQRRHTHDTQAVGLLERGLLGDAPVRSHKQDDPSLDLAGVAPGPRETFIIARTLSDAVSS